MSNNMKHLAFVNGVLGVLWFLGFGTASVLTGEWGWIALGTVTVLGAAALVGFIFLLFYLAGTWWP